MEFQNHKNVIKLLKIGVNFCRPESSYRWNMTTYYDPFFSPKCSKISKFTKEVMLTIFWNCTALLLIVLKEYGSQYYY